MTKEEAETLRPGDIIGHISNSWKNRTITSYKIIKDNLYWSEGNQPLDGNYCQCNPLSNIKIISRANQIIDTYDIY